MERAAAFLWGTGLADSKRGVRQNGARPVLYFYAGQPMPPLHIMVRETLKFFATKEQAYGCNDNRDRL